MKVAPATLLLTALVANSATAWTFTWRQSNNTPHVANGGGNKGCSGISHAKGKTFEWDRALFSDCCIKVYTNSKCSGDPAGYSCGDWTKKASVDLGSYKVESC
ncbi:MAG: hypothetical protein M1831_001716 [Alyxoria varia]|nr:MAG: hypothetical protein M1831_001716 [Alyxoria varia]